MEQIDFEVLKAYLVESKSQRWIQENILSINAPERGGGYEAMKILHAHDIRSDLKGSLAGYNATKNNIAALLSELKKISDEVDENHTYIEGATKLILINSYERDPKARSMCISHHGAVCQICGFDFYRKYGCVAQGYIEVHHLIPISSLRINYIIDPINDLIPLCSNCHSVVHRKNPPYTINEVKRMIAS